MSIGRILKWSAVAGLLAASFPVLAQEGDPTLGYGAWLIAALFEAGSLTAPPDNPGLIGTVIRPIGVMSMLVASLLIISKSIQHLLIVAQAKDPAASPISMTWAPIHMVVAITLIMPTASGYSVGQHGAIWVGEQSNTLANLTTRKVTGFFRDQGTITATPAPEMRSTIEGIIDAAVCREIINQTGGFIEDQGGNPPTISSKVYGNSPENPFAREPLSENQTATIVHKIKQSSASYTVPSGKGDPFCGGITVSFANNFQSEDPDEPKNYTAPSGGTFAYSDPDSTMGHRELITEISSLSKEEKTQRMIDAVSEANQSASETVRQLAQSHSGPKAIAQNLLFDLKPHLNAIKNQGQTDNRVEDLEQMLSNEEAEYINEAAEQTVQFYKDATRDMHGHYAKALQEQRESQGRDWTETIDTVGWPILGLYWMQMTAVDSRIKDAMDITVAPIPPAVVPGRATNMMVGDRALSSRIDNRLQRYQELVNQKLRADPMTYMVAENDSKQQVMQRFESGTSDLHTKLLDEMQDSGGEFVAEDTVVTSFFSNIFRDYVYPGMMYSLKSDDNILIGMVNAGHMIITVAETAYLTGVVMDGVEEAVSLNAQEGIATKVKDLGWEAAKWFGAAPAAAADTAASEGGRQVLTSPILRPLWELAQDILSYASLLILPGLFLAFYLPAMVMIQWLTQLVTWLIYLVEAVIVIPIWGILFISDMGQQSIAPQSARQGFVHLLSILLYPSLMVVGFVVGLKIVDLISGFLLSFMQIGFKNALDGYMFGIVSSIAGVVVVGLAAYQILMRIFSLMMELNNRVISWVGQLPSYQEGASEQAARSGVVGFIQRGENKGPSKPKQGREGGGQGAQQ